LLADYEATLDKLVVGLTPARLPLAVKIASVPDQIRGFGHVKDAAMAAAKVEAAKLWAQWEASAPSPSRGGQGGEAARVGESEDVR
jgi:indolepyruvate ferredoxin oxidoreductase